MISFIVIGKNEGWKLTKCFESIFESISFNRCEFYEVIYVDSQSSDDSIERAKLFKGIKICLLKGDCNAAIARNVGAKESRGEILFFIDGDMEIQSDFLKSVYSKETGSKFEFVSGDFLNINYDYSGNYLNEERYFKNQEILIQQEVGGLFIIKRHLWFLVDGMNSVFQRSQDIDFGLRLAKNGVFLKRLPVIAAVHHTISYRNTRRKWVMIFNLHELFGRSLLYRRNLFNRFSLKRVLKHDYSMVILIFTLTIIFLLDFQLLPSILYISVIAYRSTKNSFKIRMIFGNIIYYFLRDTTTLFGLFLFFPRTPINIKYHIIK